MKFKVKSDFVQNSIKPYELVRQSCAKRAGSLAHLSIDQEAVVRFSEKIANLPRDIVGTVDADMFYLHDDPSMRIYYVLIADSINFGSGWFPLLKKTDGKSGAVSLAIALSKYCKINSIPSPHELRSLTIDDVATIFDQDPRGEVGQLLDLYRVGLFQLGDFLIERFDGNVMYLLEEANSSAAKFISLISTIPFFNDVAIEGGVVTYFYKRAQITASDIALVSKDDLATFEDLDRLTIFADNVLPNLLRVEGVLRYSEDLNQRIASQELFAPGSSQEVELRAATVVACEQIVENLQNNHQVTISPRELDQLLWTMGREKVYKDSPRHRCRCTYY
ncbi:MAG: hypothetical protein M0019_10655 [Actinomycetota bacterium]|nr:hypothetical protein [Actinomycetota bacterium]